MMSISPKSSYIASVAYLAIPLLIWCLGWLSLLPIVVVAAAIIACYCCVFAKTHDTIFVSKRIELPSSFFIALVLVALFWCILGGQGGFLFQTSDWNERNAILRDLINYDWPVVYETGAALDYYFGIWLAPALMGKLALFVGLGEGVAWVWGNIALLIWVVLGVTLALILALQFVGKANLRAFVIVLLLFVFFSGMDFLGLLLVDDEFTVRRLLLDDMHLEWWAGAYQFSSFSTQLFWVFNQAVPAWLCTMLVLSTNTLENDIFIGVLGAFLCPLPTMGLLFIGLGKVVNLIMKKGAGKTLSSLLSIQNILAIAPLICVVLFLFLNQRSSGTGGEPLFNTYIGGVNPYRIYVLVVFALLEYGLFMLLLFPSERRNPYWWGILALFLVTNVVRMGNSGDFEMRASIPGLVVLMIMIAKRLVDNNLVSYYELFAHWRNKEISKQKKKRHRKVIASALVVCLVLGAITPIVEIVRVPVRIVQAQTLSLTSDNTKTFEGRTSKNFTALDYEDTLFKKMLGR